MNCHSNIDPKVDIKVLSKSVHSKLTCQSCHSDINTIPHKKSLSVNCEICHSDVAKEMSESIHMKSNKTNKPKCTTCHGTHDVLASSDEKSKTNFFNVTSLCTTNCHGDIQIYANSIHNQVIQKQGLTGSPVCTTCHGFHLVLPSSDKRAKTYYFNIHEICGSCHKKIFSEYKRSIHGRNLLGGNKKAPTCTTCHSEHKVTEINRVTLFGLETKECGKCHLKQSKIYQDTFHGRATFSGFERSATCTDCHNTHLILPQNDPDSTINNINIDNTCGKCHSINNIKTVNETNFSGKPKFANFKIHTSISTVLLFKTLYGFLIILLLVAFITHYLLIGPKEFKEEDKIYWFPLSNRIVHWGAAITFVILIITGLIIIFADIFGGGNFVLVSRYIHRICAFFFIIFDVIMIKLWWKYFFTKIYDIKWLLLIGGYLHRKKIHVPADKFNFGQKMWLIFSTLGGVIMFITGLTIILLPPDIILLKTSIYIHNFIGLILVGFFMIHLYMSIFVIKGSIRTMIDGYKSREEAEYMHGLAIKDDKN
jgi:formate dehydrogenase subunit gamma